MRHKLAIILGLVFVAGVIWIVVSIRRNAARKLNAERLEEARRLWTEKGPKDYVLRYKVYRSGSTTPDRFQVQVADGKVVEVWANDEKEPPSRYHHYGMDKLFDFIETFVDCDPKDAAKKALQYADFDARDGHVLRYQRHPPGGKESVEIEVEELLPRGGKLTISN
jgi:hypothetical protein